MNPIKNQERPRDPKAMEESLAQEMTLLLEFEEFETSEFTRKNPAPEAVLLVLNRWKWIMEDEDGSEEQLDFFCEMSEHFRTIESLKLWMNDLFWGDDYDNNDPEWLENEWSIVPDPSAVDFYAFKSKEEFIEQLDFEMAQKVLAAAWDRACEGSELTKGERL